MLFFFDRELADANDVIVFERELHGFLQRDLAWLVRFGFLREGGRGVYQRKQKAEQCGASVHDFVLGVAEGSSSGKPSSP